MVLVDTSVWIDHLRQSIEPLTEALFQNHICMHPMIIGELACGHLKERAKFLHLLGRLPEASTASHEEVMFLIETQGLMGRGIGYVDAHLLAACKINAACQLWTHDKKLLVAATEIGIE